MALLDFNVAQHLAQSPQPNLADQLWENGKTPVIIANCAEGESKSSGFPYFRLQIEALAGDNKGKKRSIFIMLNHTNEVVVDMGKRTLANICKACNITNLTDLDQLKYQKLIVTVGRKLNKKTNEIENSFGYYEPYVEFLEPATLATALAPYGKPAKPIEERAPLPLDDKLDDIPF